MKKLLSLLLSMMLLVACSSGNTTEQTTTKTATPEAVNAKINVYTRDSSSGTREAFEKAIGLSELTQDAIEVSSNGDMAVKVGADENGIGYVSLSTDFEANNIKPLSFKAVVPSEETVLDGSYGMQRPFAYVTRESFDSGEKEALVLAFIDYLCNSTEGMLTVQAAGGVVDLPKSVAWSELAKNHPIVNQDNSAITISTCGSTSVTKTLQAALESFVPLAGNFQFTMNQTGSGDGYKRVLGEEKDGVNGADIGFASRNFNDDEDVSVALATGTYAIDAVVAVVNKNNTLNDIDDNTLNQIYSGTLTDFNLVK